MRFMGNLNMNLLKKVLIILVLILCWGCFPEVGGEKKLSYDLIDRLDQTIIIGEKVNFPILKSVKLKKGETLPGKSKNKFRLIKVIPDDLKDQKLKDGIVEAVVEFQPLAEASFTFGAKNNLGEVKLPKRNKVVKKLTGVMPWQWKPILGQWHKRGQWIFNSPIDVSINSFNLFWEIGGEKYAGSDVLGLMQAEIGSFPGGEISIDLIFDNGPFSQDYLIANNLGKNKPHKLRGFAGIAFGLNFNQAEVQDEKKVDGFAVLTNSNSSIAYAEIQNSKLSKART